MSTTFSLPSVTVTTSLAPYAGPWTNIQAAHLLRRATFAPLKSEIDQAVNLGLAGSISKLFESIALPSPPVYYDYESHPTLNRGESFIGSHLAPDDRNADQGARRRAMESWWFLSTAEQGFNVRDKMMLFWHNHFGMGGINESNLMYDFLTRYRNFATGDFRELVRQMTVDPYMLQFLNGNQSTAANPNENYAREILELFTIGKGPQVGPGDYTTYTEEDIVELAKAFTGWRTRYFNSTDPENYPESYYVPNRHDTSTKQLSERFGNVQIPNGDENEYRQVVDIIFQQDEVARYLCRKLYRFFVYYRIDDAVETNVIEPMAQILIDNDYVVGPAIEALLASEHFYQAGIIGNQIKTPMDFVQSLFRPLAWYEGWEDVYDRYRAARVAFFHARDTGMQMTLPPSVAGWEAYYQEPSYARLWLNTSTIQRRTDHIRRCTLRRFFWDGSGYEIDWLAFIDDFRNPANPNTMIEEFVDRLLPQPLREEQLTAVKELLLPGLQDFVWSSEYNNYLQNPFDEATRMSVENRLKEMAYGFLQLAEFQVQ
ncbi:DUF1800 family protein [Lewinella sp. W8]|uniref:DUF1800 domain-containing protein n=1 Tax=Lewinella sp. W8 TaxID=2528208 RepID=UPI001067D666|nr:DUF1800 family protein [Lewinella sp. W8]MTB53778.1 DUF1800 family protein [Lewinella sp. W8]